MTLIPKISVVPSVDSSYLVLTNTTGLYDVVNNLGGFSNFVDRVAGVVTLSAYNGAVHLVGHGLTTNHKILLKSTTIIGGIEDIKVHGIYEVLNIISADVFLIGLNGVLAEFNSLTVANFDFQQCLSPVNKGLQGIEELDICIGSLKDNWTLNKTYTSASPSFFPKDVNTINLTALALGLTSNFEDDVYSLIGKMWFPLSITSDVSGTPVSRTLTFANTKHITFVGTVNVLDNLEGLGDTIYVRVSNGTLTIDTTIDKVNSTNSLLVTNDDLASLIIAGANTIVTVLIGYKLTDVYFSIKNDTIQCVSSQAVQLKINDSKCGKPCGCIEPELDSLTDVFIGLAFIDEQIDLGVPLEASKNLVALNKLCKLKDCNCGN